MTDYIEGLDVYAAARFQVELSAGHRVMHRVPLTARVNTATGEVTFTVPLEDIPVLHND